jgi:glycine/D-amino acid oxidase-like deaminating enzyme
MSIPLLETDAIIFGGGVAGLWLLNRLHRAGYSAHLLEANGLGGVQTLASQGIIHGGTKYALSGRLSGAARAIGAMPGIWRQCLEGNGEIDLSGARVLSTNQCLWSTGGLASDMAGFFANHAMRSRVTELDEGEYPEALSHPSFTGHVYRLDEPVLDTGSLVRELSAPCMGRCLRYEPGSMRLLEGTPPMLELSDPQAGQLRLRARLLVLAAGAGNQRLIAALGRARPAMQRRPLHMLMVRGQLPPLYAHCLGAGTNPRITVTSHPLDSGERVWYLGGQIAEAGVGRPTGEQIKAGRRELRELLPWLAQDSLRWATLRVDRAEPKQQGGRRPDKPYLELRDGVAVAWPTKLAFAPALADQLLQSMNRAGIRPSGSPGESPDWPGPQPARHPWQEVREWN